MYALGGHKTTDLMLQVTTPYYVQQTSSSLSSYPNTVSLLERDETICPPGEFSRWGTNLATYLENTL